MVNLHQHSLFSDGVEYPYDIAKYSKQLGYTSVALTDHGRINGWFYLEEAAKEFNLKPIYGTEFYLIPQLIKTKIRFHTTVIAKNLKGIKNIYKLITLSNKPDHFYRKPRITLNELREYSDGLIILSGCMKNPIAQAVIQNEFELAEKIFKQYNEMDFYYEIMPYDTEEITRSTNWVLKNLPVKIVATLDSHYNKPEDIIKEKFIQAVNAHLTFDKIQNQLDLYLRDRATLFSNIASIYDRTIAENAIKNIDEIENKIEYIELPKKEIKTTTEEDIKKFKHLLKQNINKIPKTKKYIDRLKKEVNLIYRKDYIPYFLKVYNIVRTAENNGIITDYGRGSAVGSLVCYILGITKVDPIKHNLLFERFISETRKDPPDIDLDFDNEGREKLIKVLSKKSKILQLSTLNLYKPKNLMEDIGRVFELPKEFVDKVKNLNINSLKDIKDEKITKKIPYFNSLVDFENKVRYIGKHASGFIIDPDIEKYTPEIKDKSTPFDHYSVSKANLLKFDILGLKTLSVVKYSQEKIDLDLQRIPFDDKKVFNSFLSKTLGIFQFEGKIPLMVAKGIKPQNIEELALCSALARPGSLRSGLTEQAISGKEDYNLMKIPGFKEIVRDTRNVLAYQEQIMQVCRLQGLDWDTTERIRKMISKSKFEDLMKYEKYFKDKYLWNKILEFGQYAFNKSHAIAYTYLSYLTAYLKVYYPEIFYYANLRVEPKKVDYILEAMHSGIKIGKIQPYYTWQIKDKTLYPGLNFIEGYKDKKAKKILQNPKKTEEVIKTFHETFILEDFFKDSKKYKEISDIQLNDLAYQDSVNRQTIPFKIKKKFIEKDYCNLLIEDYTKLEVNIKVESNIFKRYKSEIIEAERNDIMAGEVILEPNSNRGKLFKIYNLTKRKGVVI